MQEDTDIDDFTIHDLRWLPTEAASQIHTLFNSCRSHNDDAVASLARSIGDIAARGAVKVIRREGTNLSQDERSALDKWLPLRGVVKQWGRQIVEDEQWHSRGSKFAEQLGVVSRRISWHDFAPLANRALYDDWHKNRRNNGLQLRHLQQVRKHLDDVEALQPLQDVSGLSKNDQATFVFGKHGLLCDATATKRKQQNDLFGKVQLLHASHSLLRGTAINFCVRHLAQPASSDVLVSRVLFSNNSIQSLCERSIDSRYWRFLTAPYRFQKWWYAAMADCRASVKKWHLFGLSRDAPCPGWPERMTFFSCTETAHDPVATSFLVVHVIRSIVQDSLGFLQDRIEGRKAAWDIDNVRQSVVCILPPSKTNGTDDEKTSLDQGTQSSTHDSPIAQSKEPASCSTPLPHNITAPTTPTSSNRTEWTFEPAVENNLCLLRGNDAGTLLRGKLNDEAVHFGLEMMGREHPRKGCFFFNTFLVSLLHNTPCDTWAKDLVRYDNIVLPIHEEEQKHWFAAILWASLDALPSWPRDYTLVVLDPLGLETRLDPTLLDFFLRHGIRASVRTAPEDLPLQNDGISCGLFVLAYVRQFLKNPAALKNAVKGKTSIEWPAVDSHEERAMWAERVAARTAESKKDDSSSPALGSDSPCKDLEAVLPDAQNTFVETRHSPPPTSPYSSAVSSQSGGLSCFSGFGPDRLSSVPSSVTDGVASQTSGGRKRSASETSLSTPPTRSRPFTSQASGGIEHGVQKHVETAYNEIKCWSDEDLSSLIMLLQNDRKAPQSAHSEISPMPKTDDPGLQSVAVLDPEMANIVHCVQSNRALLAQVQALIAGFDGRPTTNNPDSDNFWKTVGPFAPSSPSIKPKPPFPANQIAGTHTRIQCWTDTQLASHAHPSRQAVQESDGLPQPAWVLPAVIDSNDTACQRCLSFKHTGGSEVVVFEDAVALARESHWLGRTTGLDPPSPA